MNKYCQHSAPAILNCDNLYKLCSRGDETSFFVSLRDQKQWFMVNVLFVLAPGVFVVGGRTKFPVGVCERSGFSCLQPMTVITAVRAFLETR